MEQFSRIEMLVGEDALSRLNKANIIIFGIGGVGGYTCEALVRSGIGRFTLVDADTVSESNINRQIIATHDTIGMDKVAVMKQRMLDINPKAEVEALKMFYLPENAGMIDIGKYDFVVDAVDTVSAKLEIISRAQKQKVPVISSMGAGNKWDPTAFRIADIYSTSVCPLAKVMRRESKLRGLEPYPVVYSLEQPADPVIRKHDPESGKEIPGSFMPAPAAAGLAMASFVIRKLLERHLTII